MWNVIDINNLDLSMNNDNLLLLIIALILLISDRSSKQSTVPGTRFSFRFELFGRKNFSI